MAEFGMRDAARQLLMASLLEKAGARSPNLTEEEVKRCCWENLDDELKAKADITIDITIVAAN